MYRQPMNLFEEVNTELPNNVFVKSNFTQLGDTERSVSIVKHLIFRQELSTTKYFSFPSMTMRALPNSLLVVVTNSSAETVQLEVLRADAAIVLPPSPNHQPPGLFKCHMFGCEMRLAWCFVISCY